MIRLVFSLWCVVGAAGSVAGLRAHESAPAPATFCALLALGNVLGSAVWWHRWRLHGQDAGEVAGRHRGGVS